MLARPGYELHPMPVAAEIRNLDLSRIGAEETREALYADWMQYGVLVFRDCPVTNAEHLALSGVFGEPEMHPMPEIRSAEEPLMMELGGKKPGRAFVYDGDKLRVDRIAWHRDTAYTVEICKGALLRVVERPPEAGNTDFCDTAMAYDALDQEMKDRIENLEFKATLTLNQAEMRLGATWKSIRPATPEEAPGSKFNVALDVISRYPSVVHPLVITHPESGRKCIYISPIYLDEILGMDPKESWDLLTWISEYTVQPRFCYRHTWRENDLVLWDNRRMMHSATGYDPKYRRRALRTTLAGSLKSGRLFDPNAVEVKAALVD